MRGLNLQEESIKYLDTGPHVHSLLSLSSMSYLLLENTSKPALEQLDFGDWCHVTQRIYDIFIKLLDSGTVKSGSYMLNEN